MLGKLIIKPIFITVLKIISAVIYIATILSAFGGRVDPQLMTFPAFLCLAFPYFAIATIMLTVVWAFMVKIFFCGLGIFTIVICLTPLSVTFPVSGAKEADPGNFTFSIISWNVLHARDIRRTDYPGNRAVEYLTGSGADIICLAEIEDFKEEFGNLSKAQHDSLFKAYPYHAGVTSTDIKVLAKYPVERLDLDYGVAYPNRRFEFFKVFFPEGHELVIGMVHLYSFGLSEQERNVVTEINSVSSAKTSIKEMKGPIREKMKLAFTKRAGNATLLRSYIDDINKDMPLIICGDFNDVPASWTYNIIKGDDLRDAYAETNFGPAITYNLHAFYFHIDQMLYRGPLRALDLKVGKIDTSDHYPLVGEFEFVK